MTTHFMSKRDTPLLGSDVLCVLGLSHESYETALSDGRLQRSIEVANDPTGRLAFHNFWDLLELSLTVEFAKHVAVLGADADFAARFCDELASGDQDVIAITGNVGADHDIVRRSWTDDAIAEGWPPCLLDHCTRLLVRVGHHIHAVAAATKRLEASGWSYYGNWAQDDGAASAVDNPNQSAMEFLWQERRAA